MNSSSSRAAASQAVEAGFPSKYFVNRPPDSLLCGLCLEVLNNPVQCPNGHCFCKECIIEALALRTLCPVCNVSTPTFQNYNANIVARDVIEYLPARCHTEAIKPQMDYCTWTGPFQQRNVHISKCQYQLTDCRNADCTMKVSKKNMTHHLLHECPQRSVKCEYCSRLLIYDSLAMHHKTCTDRLAAKSAQLKAALHVGNSTDTQSNQESGSSAAIPMSSSKSGASASILDSKSEIKMSSPSRRKKSEASAIPAATEAAKSIRSSSEKINGQQSLLRQYRLALMVLVVAIIGGVVASLVSSLKQYFPHDPNVHSFADSVEYFSYFLHRLFFPSANECADGYCMFQFESNDIYIGHWLDYSMHGQGYYQFNSSGDVYVGNFDHDRMHGYGVYSGRLGVYDGDWVMGTRSGRAVFSYPNGDVYNGSFHENMFNGYGNLSYSNSQYLGNFYNDMFHGIGELKFPNGDRYKGDWQYNARTGRGTLTNVDGEYTGEFTDNQKSGRGVMRWHNGDVYEGDYHMDAMDGEGIMTYANGDQYLGEWSSNMRHGYGVFQSLNIHYVYEGEWFENHRHGTGKMRNEVGTYEGDFYQDAVTGQGTYSYHESSVYSGGVKNGLRDGQGTYHTASGEVYEGLWTADRLSGDCRISYLNGDYYTGVCQDMSMIKGTLHYANGDQFEGEFYNNQRHGLGRFYAFSTGETHYNHYEHGVRIDEGTIIDAKGKVISGGHTASTGVEGARKAAASGSGGPSRTYSSKGSQKPITGHKRSSASVPH